MPLAITTSGARCLGTPRKRSKGSSAPSSSSATLRSGSSALTRRPGISSIPRSANSASSAAEASGEGGTGVGNGITKEIRQASRTPRERSSSSSSRAHSLGAGGHLNGAPETPITACPSENVGMISASCSAPATE
jgi:hypothetical protein